MNYFRGILIALDQLANTLFRGWPDETLSSRCYRWDRDGQRHWPKRLVNLMFFWQKDHCFSAYENEKLRMQCPPELRVGNGAD